MENYKKIGFLVAALIMFGAGCAQAPKTEAQPVVATTIVALTSVTSNILDGVIPVESVLPKGAEPHDVILSTRELQTLTNAKAIVTLGLTLDDWIANGISATNAQAPVVVASNFLNLPPELNDPHVWLSPKRMIVMSRGITARMQEIFPESAKEIAENGAAYEIELEKLDGEFRALGALKNRDIVTLHDAFGYLAQDYGLNVVAVVKDLPEDSPSPEDVARVIAMLSKYPDAALFGESEISPAILKSIAKDTGRTIYILDPLELGASDAPAYIAAMKKNLAVLKEALAAQQK